MACKKDKPPPNVSVSVPSGIPANAESPTPDFVPEKKGGLLLCICRFVAISLYILFYAQPRIQRVFRNSVLEATPFPWQVSYLIVIPCSFPVRGGLCWIRGIVPSSTCNDFPLNCKTMAMIDLMRDWKSQLIAINSWKQKLVLGFPKNFSSTLVP